jgi:hypothetical protein
LMPVVERAWAFARGGADPAAFDSPKSNKDMQTTEVRKAPKRDGAVESESEGPVFIELLLATEVTERSIVLK